MTLRARHIGAPCGREALEVKPFLVGCLCEPKDIRSMTGRYFIERDRITRSWHVLQYVNEDRGSRVVEICETEQLAERAVRRLLFPLPQGEDE